MKYLFTALYLLASSLTAAEFTYTESNNSGNNIALGYPVPLPIDSLTPIDGFRSYNSLDLRHKQLAAQASWLTAINLGVTFNNRPIWGYKLSDNDNTTVSGAIEGSALINGGIHAREWQSPEALTGYMETLFDKQNNQHIEQYLIENLNLLLIPVLNIDGFLQTQSFPTTVTSSISSPRDGRMRRKNMNAVDGLLSSTNDNFFGVDLNRNNNPYWATDANNSSSATTSIVHHGSGAASEPETQALQNAAQQVGEARLRFYTDTHSFTQIYFTPMTSNQRRNNITRKLADIMRAANNYKYRYRPWSAGSGIGSTDEYFANTYQIPSYTLEIEPLNSGADYGGNGISHDGFIMPASEVNRMRQETSIATLAGLYAIAELPMVQELIIKQNNNIVFHQQWQTSAGTRTLVTLLNNVLNADTLYQLNIIFNKPMRQISNEQVTSFASFSSATNISIDWFIKTTNTEKTQAIELSTGSWLMQGFKQYKTDTYQVDFTFPDDFDWNTTTLLALNVDTTDMTGQALDTNPATVTDWQLGYWINYEDTQGNLTDSGGIDKSMRLIDDNSLLYPDDSSITDPGATTPPPEPPATTNKSGGVSWTLLWLIVLVFFKKGELNRLSSP